MSSVDEPPPGVVVLPSHCDRKQPFVDLGKDLIKSDADVCRACGHPRSAHQRYDAKNCHFTAEVLVLPGMLHSRAGQMLCIVCNEESHTHRSSKKDYEENRRISFIIAVASLLTTVASVILSKPDKKFWPILLVVASIALAIFPIWQSYSSETIKRFWISKNDYTRLEEDPQ